MFSLARNDKTAKEPRDLRAGLDIVYSCLSVVNECYFDKFRKNNSYLKFWALENPASGYLNRFLGDPYYKFNPCDHGDAYTKKTALWGMFNIPKKNPVKPREITHSSGAKDFVSIVEHFADMKNIPEGYCEKTGYSKRKVLRSMTPYGFASAFCEANK
jgi:hypothetical protein